MVFKFYDTCSLLLKANEMWDENHLVISSITLEELENIKTHKNKQNSSFIIKIINKLIFVIVIVSPKTSYFLLQNYILY